MVMSSGSKCTNMQVVIILPNLEDTKGPKSRVTLSPLYAEANPAESSHRVLSTKVSPCRLIIGNLDRTKRLIV